MTRHRFSRFMILATALTLLATSFGLLVNHAYGSDLVFGETINLSKNSGFSFSPQIATSRSNVYVVWENNTSTVLPSEQPPDVLIAVSNNNGTTFSSPVNLSNTPNGRSIRPQVAASSNNVYAVWMENVTVGSFDIFFRASTRGGTSFGTTINLSSDSGRAGDPQIAAVGITNIYVTWEGDARSGNPGIFFKASTDSGATFGATRKLSESSSSYSGGSPQIAATGNNVYVAWRDNHVTPVNDEIFFKASSNNGAIFGPVRNLSSDSGASRDQRITSVGSDVYVVWTDVTVDPLGDVMFARSIDGGGSFGTVNLSNTPGEASYEAHLAAVGPYVYAVWVDSSGIFIKTSIDSGGDFGAAVNLSSSGYSVFPEVAAAGNNVYVAWLGNYLSPDDDLFFRSSSDNAGSFGTTVNLSNGSGFSVRQAMAAAGERVFVTWEKDTGPPEKAEVLFRASPVPFDYSLSVNPNSGKFQVGGSISATVTSTYVAGTAESVDLDATGQPLSIVITFDPLTGTLVSGTSFVSTMTIFVTTNTTVLGGTTPTGTFAITITGTSTDGVIRTTTFTLTVVAPVTGDFTFAPTDPTAGEPVSFTATATGGTSPYSFTWDFGDGISDSGQTITHTYATKGFRTVALTVTDANAVTLTVTRTVTINPLVLLAADFSVSPDNPTIGKPVSFTATASGGTAPYTFAWHFGDSPGGFEAFGQTVQHTYANQGGFGVTVVVTDSNSFLSPHVRVVLVAAQPLFVTVSCPASGITAGKPFKCTVSAEGGTPPYSGTGSFQITEPIKGISTERFFVTDANGVAASGSARVTVDPQPIVVEVTCPASSLTAGKPFSCSVFATGGTAPYTGTGSFTITEPLKGTFTETFTVTDANHATASGSASVTVAPQAFAIDFVFDPLAPTVGNPVTFIASATGGTTPYTFSWDFDGGSPASGTGETFTTIYTAKGFGTVSLTATDANNVPLTITHAISIAPMSLAVDFSLTPSSPSAGDTVTFTATASGGTTPYSFSWDFGDSLTLNCCSAVTHTYATKGFRTVTLTITDANGVTLAVTHPVTVNPLPMIVDFSLSPDNPTVGKPVSFIATGSGGTAPYTFSWDFGDGSGLIGSSVSHTYSVKSSYSMTLVAIDLNNAMVSIVKTVIVAPQPLRVDFGSTPSSPITGQTVAFTATLSGGTLPYVVSWSFGDGSSGTGSLESHVYTATGTFMVSLSVTDTNTMSASASKTITVQLGDADNDGTYDNVDTMPLVFSSDFSDTSLGGTTTGTIALRGDQILSIIEEPNPAGVRIAASPSGGITPATITPCGGSSRITFTPGDQSVVTCGSVTVQVLEGTVEITFFGSGGSAGIDGMTSLSAGNTITFQPTTFTLTAAPTNTAPVIVIVQGEIFSILPGQTLKVPQVTVSKFYTDPSLIPLPRDAMGNPRVDVVLANGSVKSTNPGQVLAWVNVTNTGGSPFKSLRLNETLPADWRTNPPWTLSRGAIHVFFVFRNGTRVEITSQSTITVSAGNPETITLSVNNIASTPAGESLQPGEKIQLSAKIAYSLVSTSQSARSYPRNYTDVASGAAWTDRSYTGTPVSRTGSAFFIAYAKVVDDVNGDFKVDIHDATLVASAYEARPGDARWDERADLDGNGIVNILDVALAAYWYGTKS